MTREPSAIQGTENITSAAQSMARKKIGSLVVMEGEEPIGIITEQDLARKVVAQGIDPEMTAVSEIMSSKLHSVLPDKDIYEAVVLMGKKQVKHLPVVVGGRLTGIISFKDVIAIHPDLIELVTFKNAVRKLP